MQMITLLTGEGKIDMKEKLQTLVIDYFNP